MFSRFFVRRPVFAWVIAILIMLAGILAIRTLPVAQYPDVAPPTIKISATYTGASAETLENSVTQVIEQQLTGLDNLLYFSSTSSSDGSVSINETFEQGTDPDTAQVQVQNKIQQAESRLPLKSANADIGAARANFFPTISLTASAGVGSDALSSLFSHGMQIWSFTPSVTLPLFTGGSNLAQLRYAEAQKRGLIATYEKTVQSAFKDVANALARRTTLEEQLDAQRQYVKAEQQTVDVGLRRYQTGVGDYLTVLTAQRSLWSAQQELLALQLTDFTNRITLWQSLGGGMSSLK